MAFFLIPFVFADSGVTTLFDETITLQGCAADAASCPRENPMVIERFIPGGGYLGVYIKDNSKTVGTYGGLDLEKINFESSSGVLENIGNGLQVFEPGKILVQFYQPYNEKERIDSEYDLTIWYLPHTDIEKQQFLTMLQNDETNYIREKEKRKRKITPLCGAVAKPEKLPFGCQSAADAGKPLDQKTSIDQFPELDFSQKPHRVPDVNIKKREFLTFSGEPITVKVDNVTDQDGKCNLWEFFWKKPKRLATENFSIDPRFGDLKFVPKTTGVFLLQLRVQEACKSLGTLSSGMETVRVIVNDKSADFSDLFDNPYQNFLYELYHRGAVKGYEQKFMRPDSPVNRAEFLKMIFSALQFDLKKDAFSPRFADVPTNKWFAPYVYQADTMGVIKGYPDGKFHPERPVNLAEALKIILQFTNLEILDTETVPFQDVNPSQWFSRYIQTAFREGIWDEIQPKGKVRPGKAITRGQAAKIIVRSLFFPTNRINRSQGSVPDKSEEFEDFSSF